MGATIGRQVSNRPGIPWWRRRSVRHAFASTLSIAVAGLGAGAILVPFVWMVSTSLKTPPDVVRFPPTWIPNPVAWDNYPSALTILPFATFAVNTLIITMAATTGILVTASISAFAFSRLHWPGRDVIFFLILSEMFLPGPVTLIPKFILFKELGWVDTFLPLTVPSFFGGSAFNIFLLRQFFLAIPPELDDAARIDGCSTLGTYWRIILPLSKPALGIVTIFAFQHNWNDFFLPLIYLSSERHYTLSLGLRMFRGEFQTSWNLMMAASLVVMLPLIVGFFVVQRHYVQGIVFTGIKG